MKTYKVQVKDDCIIWYHPKTNKRHREDGPAVEYADGDKAWYKNGKLHRMERSISQFRLRNIKYPLDRFLGIWQALGVLRDWKNKLRLKKE